MADTKLAKVGITVKESWKDDISYEVLDYTLWRVQDGGDGCGYIAKRANIGVVPNSDDSVWIKATQAGQSIYDLAVKYGHFVGTEEEFEAEYQAALQAARDAASETSATNAEIQEAEELRKTAENARVEAETARQTAETGRQTAETARQTAETARETAETQRGENETTRQSQETARESSETQRQSNESTRQSNETARESAEQERTADFEALKTDMETAIGEADAATAAAVALNNQVAGDESARQQAEQSRVAAETQRQNAETQRGTNEQTRQTQETARQTAEQTRNTQETARQTAEGQRATAEQGRASAESQRVSNETARQNAETARETQATTDHQRAEDDHAIAEEDHATLDEKISHKADIDGSYDGMAVGIARNLEGRADVTDSFFKRTTGGDAEVANGTAQLNEVKGKSQVWNQLVYDESRSQTSDGITTSYDANTHLVSITNNERTQKYSSGSTQIIMTNGRPIIPGHKYIALSSRTTDGIVLYFMENSNTGLLGIFELNSIAVAPSGSGVIRLRITNQYDFVNEHPINDVFSFYLNIIDLTLLGIDDLTTVEEVEAWLAENIGEMPYYPYNEGEVLNNRMTGVESIGFNLLDPATGKADIIGAYSDVYGNYYGITGTHGALTFTDKFGNTETITPDSDGKFLLEKAGTLSVADAGEDCAVFIWWDGTQTEYKPYEKNEGKLDVTHIYGKLNGEGEYVRVWPTGMPGIGDIKDSLKVVDGQVVAERKIAYEDMGVLGWTRATADGNNIMYATNLASKVKKPTSDTIAANILCHKFVAMSNRQYRNNLGAMSVNVNGFLYVRTDETDAATFKASVNGVLIYYELATPVVYTDLIYRDSEAFADNTPVTLPVNYKVDNWGIERIAPQNTEEAVVTSKPELTMRYSIDAVEELNTHRDMIENLDERKPEKYGEYPDMAVGSAKTLAGQDTKVEDFFFKPIECADGLAKLNSARGKSLVWNQGVSVLNTSKAGETNGVTFTLENNNSAFVLNGTSTDEISTFYFIAPREVPMQIAGHKYFFKGVNLVGVSGGTYRIVDRSGRVSGANDNGAGFISSAANSGGSWYLSIEIPTGVTFNNTKIRPILIDLTLMFGAGNEPATVEEFEAMFPLPYYDYNPGEILSNKTEEVKVVGFNQWDEEWEMGEINADDGENRVSNTAWRTKNYIPILPNTQYYIEGAVLGSASSARARFYDAEKNYLGTAPSGDTAVNFNTVFTSPSNAYYMRLAPTNSIIAPGAKLCINLSDTARNGEYEPYKTNTIELNLPTLTGKLNGEGESVVVFPDGLKSAGTAYDEIVIENGYAVRVIKRIKTIDLGDTQKNQWAKYDVTQGTLFRILLSDRKNGNIKSSVGAICARYVSTTPTDRENKTLSGSVINTDFIDNDYSTVDSFYASLPGLKLAYELATPEEYILDAPLPDTFQAYKGGTIKQLPENGSAPVTAPMVMTVTYAIDAVGTLVGLPRNYVSKESLQAMLNAMQSAGIIASYTMTYNENTGKYDFTFVAPTNS